MNGTHSDGAIRSMEEAVQLREGGIGWAMRALKQLLRSLTKVVDLSNGSLAFNRVSDGIHIHRPLVCEVVEHIVGCHGLRPSLLEPKDKINPFCEMKRRNNEHVMAGREWSV